MATEDATSRSRWPALPPALWRLAGAAVFVALGVIGLWRAGLLFGDEGEVAGQAPGGEAISLRPADVSVATPPFGGLAVGLREGELAPDFEFSAFDGRRLRLSQLRGRAVLLNFWATWCGPCKQELPDMETLLNANADRLAVVAVNVSEAYGPANRFLQGLEVELTAFGYDPRGDVARRYGVYGLPTSYFIDAAGVIRRVVASQMSLKLMQTLLAETLAAKAE